MSLSDRLRPNVEAAPWVVEELKLLEREMIHLSLRAEGAEHELDKALTKVATLEQEIDQLRSMGVINNEPAR